MSTSSGVAIVGMAVRLPDAPNLGAFRNNLRAGRDSVRALSRERLRACRLDEHADYLPMAHVGRIDLFDYQFFGYSRREAEVMDPHHRISLQLACAAIEDAGYRLSALRGTRTSVLLAAPHPGYAELMSGVDTLGLLGSQAAALPGRISQFLGLTGESLVIDTGCSSGLVVVHHVVQELVSGRAEYALTGAMSLGIRPNLRADVERFPEVMSSSGQCRAFDAEADGTSDGEGGALLLLTTLERARAEGAHVYAVLRGSAIRHNGDRSAELAAPSVSAQEEVITEAWHAAGLKPVDAGYVETHGSGTKLGDAVEVQALAGARRGANDTLSIGSVKTNIGHLNQAAGIAGLVKAVLSVRHGELYPSLHFTEPPPEIDLTASGVEVMCARRPWASRGQPRRAGVSAFSLTGVNAHCVVEQPPVEEIEQPDAALRIVTVSARTENALARYCELLAAQLRRERAALADVAYVLNAGRDDYAYRVAVIGRDNAEVVRALSGRAAEIRRDGAAAVPEGARLYLLLSGDSAEPAACGYEEPDEAILSGPAGDRFRWQRGWHAALADLGAHTDGLLSSGTGKCAARTVRGEATVAEAVTELATPGGPAEPGRVTALVDQLLAEGPAVFLEVGSGGELVGLIRRHVAGRRDAAVLELPGPGTDEPDAALGVLAELYRQGAAVDWDSHHRTVGGGRLPRRVPLPTYPFDEQACWIPEDQLRTGVGGAAGAAVADSEPMGEGVADQVRQAWQRALRAEDVPADANYFALGGNSITALDVITRIDKACGVRLKMIDLYEHPTPADLTALITERRAATGIERRTERITPGSPPVLSFGQERFWFHHELEGDNTLYNLPSFFRLLGPVDVAALRGALADLATRHEVLRSRFPTVDGLPALAIDDHVAEALRLVDVSGEADPMAEGRRILDEEAACPFDLAAGPLFRNVLVAVGQDDYLLCMNVHHAVDDGWSPEILDRELGELYAARRDGRQARLDALPIRYRDYACWQRAWLTGDVLERELGYWREKLRGIQPLGLPTDRPRPSRKDYTGRMYSFTIPGEVVGKLRVVGQQESTTLFTVFLAATATLLARYSCQDDITIGSATSGRSKPETRDIIGFFNNLMSLRVDLSNDPDVPELLRRVRDAVLGALEHDEVPFDKVVEAVAPERDLGRHPLFDVVFVHQTIPELSGDLGGTPMELFASDDRSALLNGIAPGTAKYDLSFCVWDQGERDEHEKMLAGIEFSSQLFDADTIADMAQRWVYLLTEIARDHRRDALDLPLSSEDGEVISGPEAFPVEEEESLVSLVVAQVQQHPDAVAVDEAGAVVTYRQLWDEVGRIAELLRGAGIQRGDPVAVALPRSATLVAAALAIMHRGAVYVPLDPTSHPAQRLDFQLGDSGARAVVTRSGALPDSLTWQGLQLNVDSADVAAPGGLDAPVAMQAPIAGVNDTAYVIYTSGSTGRPKGVRLAHRGAVNVVRATVPQWELGPGARVLQFAPATFDASVWEIFSALASGATLCIPPSDVPLVGQDLAECLTKKRIEVTMLPPSIIASLPEQSFPDLRVLVAGGEPLPHELVERFAPGRRMLNAYGPTETTIIVTQGECVADGRRPSMGAPIPGMRFRIHDTTGRPVPPGVPGELYIGGLGVACGYVNRAELTASRFLPDPTGPPGSRMYRTGDLVRLRRDGSLEFVARVDHQVKHRGYRIELGEIEAVARTCDGVRQAAVVLYRDEVGERLVAFASGAVSADAVRAVLEKKLPSYMVPASVVVLDALPLTTSGKVDRKSLAVQTPVRAEPELVEQPRDAAERAVAEIFEEVLATGPIGRDANFFQMGGHSLLAVRLLRRLKALTGRMLALAVLFEAPTVAKLAEVVRDGESAPYRCLVPIRRDGSRPPLFCVHASGGNVLSYQPLANTLDVEQPIYGLQSYGLGPGNEPDLTVTGMAERYVAEIREVVPEGPYYLAGWSFGGMVACEMARLLGGSGAPVAMVALLDTDITARPPEHSTDDAQLLVEAVEPWLESGVAQRLRAVGGQLALDEALRAAQDSNLMPKEMSTSELTRFLRVLRANDRAAAGWGRGPIPAPVFLLRARDGHVGPGGICELGELADGPLTIRDVPGDHYTMMTTHIARVGAQLEECLNWVMSMTAAGGRE
ncbi:MAG: amino acid adenylation domain-containing protein [Pseudonocardiaceae bacterium]